jgi:hypothetical protein
MPCVSLITPVDSGVIVKVIDGHEDVSVVPAFVRIGGPCLTNDIGRLTPR